MSLRQVVAEWPTVNVFDVGARGGLHKRWRRCIAPVVGIGFDADANECARLNALETGVRYLPYVLGAENGTHAALHITASPGSSSLFEPNMGFVEQFPYGSAMAVQRTIAVTLTTLDSVCEKMQVMPDVLKLDIQGGELDVLKGARKVLPSTLLVESEVEFNQQYKNGPLFGDMDRFLREQGWQLLGLRRSYWRRYPAPSADGGTLMHGDALWINEDLISTAGHETHLKAIAALRVYRQLDYVAKLAGECSLNSTSGLYPVSPWWARAVRPLMRVFAPHRQWRAWLDMCCPPEVTDWHDPDDFF